MNLDDLKGKVDEATHARLVAYVGELSTQAKTARTKLAELEGTHAAQSAHLTDALGRLGVADVAGLQALPASASLATADAQAKARLEQAASASKKLAEELAASRLELFNLRSGAKITEAMGPASDWASIADARTLLTAGGQIVEDGAGGYAIERGGARVALADAVAALKAASPHLLAKPAPGGSGYGSGHSGVPPSGQNQQAQKPTSLASMTPSQLAEHMASKRKSA